MSRDDRDDVVERTHLWLRDAVIGLNLCPFAGPVFRDDDIDYRICDVVDFDAAIEEALGAVETLVAEPQIATTLVIYPAALADFDDYLDAAAVIEGLLEESGAEELLQLATFHPDYVFEGADRDDPANYTNRSPYPLFHFIRVADAAAAIDSHPDPAAIPDRNVETMRNLGMEAIRRMWEQWTES